MIIKNCTNTKDISFAQCGGIVGPSGGYTQNSTAILNIQDCSNSGNITGSESGGVAADNFGYGAEGSFNIFGCTNSGSLSTDSASLIYSIKDVSAANININNNTSTNTISDCSNIGFIHNISSNFNTIRKNFNINNNTIISTINNGSNISSLINTIYDCSNITFDICNNTITNTLTDASFCSGILHNIYSLDDCSLNCLNNTVNLTYNSGTESNAGIVTINENNLTFYNINDCSLNISDNSITLNTMDNLNNSIFSVNSGLSEDTAPYTSNKTSSLVLENNTINGVTGIAITEISDIYFPTQFRPYVLVIANKAESNYWFIMTTDIDNSNSLVSGTPIILLYNNINGYYLKRNILRA